MTERKLATVRIIAEVKDISEADKIQAYREGFVYKSTKDTSISVKCISDTWLLKNDG